MYRISPARSVRTYDSGHYERSGQLALVGTRPPDPSTDRNPLDNDALVRPAAGYRPRCCVDPLRPPRVMDEGWDGEIQVSEATKELVQEMFDLRHRGTIEVKGQAPMGTWILERRSTS